jgi:hypothetical protein
MLAWNEIFPKALNEIIIIIIIINVICQNFENWTHNLKESI